MKGFGAFASVDFVSRSTGNQAMTLRLESTGVLSMKKNLGFQGQGSQALPQFFTK
jgi:hypothetical protein